MGNHHVANGAAAKRQRQEDAAARAEEVTPEFQIAVLDARLGEGKGALKERYRLHAQIDSTTKKKGKKK